MLKVKRDGRSVAVYDIKDGRERAGWCLYQTTQGRWVFVAADLSPYTAAELIASGGYMPDDGYNDIDEALDQLRLQPHNELLICYL